MARTPSTMLALGTKAPDFDLYDPRGGGRVALADFAGKPLLVAFICNHCPYVVHIRDAFAAFARQCVERGVNVVAINSNDVENYPDDSPERMAEAARQYDYPFPYLFDESQFVAQAYRAACTPDFFLFDAPGELYYRGQFDGSRPGNDVPVTGSDMRAAVDALLQGAAAPEIQLASLGCNIKWKPGNEPDYFG